VVDYSQHFSNKATGVEALAGNTRLKALLQSYVKGGVEQS